MDAALPWIVPFAEIFYGAAQCFPKFYSRFEERAASPHSDKVKAVVTEVLIQLYAKRRHQSRILEMLTDCTTHPHQTATIEQFVQGQFKVVQDSQEDACFVTGCEWPKEGRYYVCTNKEITQEHCLKAFYPVLEDSVSEERSTVVLITFLANCVFKFGLKWKGTRSFGATVCLWSALRLYLLHRREQEAVQFSINELNAKETLHERTTTG